MGKILFDEEVLIFMENIIFLRKEHRLSKKKMAQLLGIGLNTLNKLERREIPPMLKIDIVFNISRHFNTTPKELFAKRLGNTPQ